MFKYLLKINGIVFREFRLISEGSYGLPWILCEWYAENDGGVISNIEIVKVAR